MTVAELLKSARERAGLDVHAAAKVAGVHFSAILAVENGIGFWQTAKQIARMMAKRRLRAVAHRDRKQSTNAIAEAAGVRFETSRPDFRREQHGREPSHSERRESCRRARWICGVALIRNEPPRRHTGQCRLFGLRAAL